MCSDEFMINIIDSEADSCSKQTAPVSPPRSSLCQERNSRAQRFKKYYSTCITDSSLLKARPIRRTRHHCRTLTPNGAPRLQVHNRMRIYGRQCPELIRSVSGTQDLQCLTTCESEMVVRPEESCCTALPYVVLLVPSTIRRPFRYS
jgi:hypothetical protein